MRPQEMDQVAIELVPELDSEWARSPISYRQWRTPVETLDNGQPCFIPSAKDLGPRKDYIYMPKRKDLQAGYYHLRTQEAYVQVYYRLREAAPPRVPCCGRHTSTVSRKDYLEVKRLIHNRVISQEPDDVQAARMALLKVSSAGGKAAAFGKAAYLPTLTTVLLMNLGMN